jgi:putative transcriptional regulator
VIDLQAGDLLVSPPAMIDSRFEKTVLLLTHHGEVGSLALCVNRLTEHKVNDILKELDLKLEKNFPLYWGGPVNPSTIWMLHSKEWRVNTTISINENWSLTSHVTMFHRLKDDDVPKKFRIFFGQASWSPGQLRGELEGDPPWNKSHSWLIVKNPNPIWLMDTSAKNLWIEATQTCGEQAVEKWLV